MNTYCSCLQNIHREMGGNLGEILERLAKKVLRVIEEKTDGMERTERTVWMEETEEMDAARMIVGL